jgi:protein SCO1
MRDIHVRGIVWAGVGIALTIAAVIAGVFLLLHWRGVPAGGAPVPAQLRRDAPALWIAPQRALEQRPGAKLPLDVQGIDEGGAPHRLAEFFAGNRPVLLVPSYYRCSQLCGLVMHGLLQSLERGGEQRWRVVAFSIAPNETSADARARRDADLSYASFVGLAKPDLHLLTLAPADVDRLARVLGFKYQRLRDDIVHPATVVVVTPRGTVSRYFNGVAFDPGELRVALADAAGDRVGAITSRIVLMCSHFDPRTGTHDGDVMAAVRIVSLALVAALAAWIWRHRQGGAR